MTLAEARVAIARAITDLPVEAFDVAQDDVPDAIVIRVLLRAGAHEAGTLAGVRRSALSVLPMTVAVRVEPFHRAADPRQSPA